MSSEARLPPGSDAQGDGTVVPAGGDEIDRLLESARPQLKVAAEELLGGSLERRIDASDLVQETLLKGAQQSHQFQGTTQGEFTAWLMQILKNTTIDTVRHHTSQKRDFRREAGVCDQCVDGASSPSSVFRSQEDQARVTAALAQLNADQREVLLLRNEGLTFEELGRRLNRSADAARMLWGRSILSLGKLLESTDSHRDK